MIKLIYVLFLSFLSIQVYAQSSLKGVVKDLNNIGLAGVTVFIPEFEMKTITDVDGKFSFDNIGKGIIRIQYSLLGYLTKVETIDLNKKSNEIVAGLTQSSIPIEEIVVTSNHTDLARNIPYPISTVSSEDLQKSGQITLMEKLAREPGVDLISGGSGIGKPVIRGLSFNRIVFYSMGTRVENQQWDDDHDAGIAEAGLDKVEIVYGPAALIYGADALGGAMIFIDEKPAPSGKITGNVNLGYFSNTHGINSDIGLKGSSTSGLFYMANINNQSHTDYIPGTSNNAISTTAINSRFNNFSGKAKIGIGRKWGMSKISYSYLKSLTGMIVDNIEDSIANVNGEPFIKRDRSLKAPYQDVNLQILSLENTILSGTSKWNLNVAYQLNNRKEFEPVLPDESPYVAMGLLLKTFTYDAKWSSNEDKKFGVTLGTQGMIQSNKNLGNNIAVPDADVNNFALFGLCHFNTGSKWKLSGGVRMDARIINIKETFGVQEGEATMDSLELAALASSGITNPVSTYSRNYNPVSFSIGSVFNPVNNFSLKMNLSTGFTAPNYSQLSTFGKHEGTNHFERGNANLKSEQNVEGDVSAMWNLVNFSFNVSAFYNHINDYIYLSPTDIFISDLQVIEYRQNDALIKGGTLRADIHPSSLKWLKINSAFTFISGKLADNSYLPYIPAEKLITELRIEKEKIRKINHPYFSILLRSYLSQNHTANYEAPTGGYNLTDVYIGIDFNLGNQTVHAGIFCTNIFDIAYYNHLSIIKDMGIYEMGRNVGLQLRIPIGY